MALPHAFLLYLIFFYLLIIHLQLFLVVQGFNLTTKENGSVLRHLLKDKRPGRLPDLKTKLPHAAYIYFYYIALCFAVILCCYPRCTSKKQCNVVNTCVNSVSVFLSISSSSLSPMDHSFLFVSSIESCELYEVHLFSRILPNSKKLASVTFYKKNVLQKRLTPPKYRSY